MLVLSLALLSILMCALRMTATAVREQWPELTDSKQAVQQQQQQQQLSPLTAPPTVVPSAPPAPFSGGGWSGAANVVTEEVPMAVPVSDFDGGSGGGGGKDGVVGGTKVNAKPTGSASVGIAAMSVSELSEWLHATGKGAYAQSLAAAGIDGAVLCDATTTAQLLVEAVPSLPLIISLAILREAQST